MTTEEQQYQVDEALIAALQSGDAVAWEVFVERYWANLQEYLRYRLPTEESVDDVLSDTILAAVQSIQQFPSDRSLQAWVYGLAHRKVSDFWRRQQLYPANIDTPGFTDLAFRALMAELPDPMLHALLLRYQVGLSVQEIAEALGRTLKATESLLQRAQRQWTNIVGVEPMSIYLTGSADEVAQPQVNAIFGMVYPMLLLQQQLCQQNQMVAEATIFERAQQQIEQLSTIPTHDFLAELQKVEDILVSKDPAQLIRALLERHYKYDSSRQL